jgi:hypothetical protein
MSMIRLGLVGMAVPLIRTTLAGASWKANSTMLRIQMRVPGGAGFAAAPLAISSAETASARPHRVLGETVPEADPQTGELSLYS